ncbi:perosamine synthetase [Nocardioides sp. BE266]|uniref:DegT/DnrJ/EryC1/StrS family aminotransferase n=1 Tax=Nocardioides sp. BE266 TaxID=2817725 RepID=UPI002857E1A5|nr:DegT/DnrJ/EryC1/StrS family aminotransferase [Nocardioides sp. BE266]MDR7252401.1 perosamine synthetase [Nocardioides sp. BE266]
MTGTIEEPATRLADVPMARPWFGPEEVQAVSDVVASGWVSQGARVVEFEAEIAAAVDARHAVAVSNCTTALHLGMVVASLGVGDEVIVPSLSFVASANVIRYVGATPVFADVSPLTHNITPESVLAAITPRTRAVMVVHQCGVPADLGTLRALCDEHGLELLEDAACAIGSTYLGRPIGSDSRFAAFSFHPRKVLVTGEGGMITTDDAELAARLGRLRQHAMSVSSFDRDRAGEVVVEQYLETGFNFRMTDMQAALGIVQCRRLAEMIATRRRLGQRYRAVLGDVPGLEIVGDPDYGQTNYQSFWVVLPDDAAVSRDELLRRLLEAGVHARHGVTASHLEPAFADVRHPPLPVTERVARQSVLLPIYHEMPDSAQDRVAAVFAEALSGRHH